MSLYEIVMSKIRRIEYDYLTGDEYGMLYPKEEIEPRYEEVKIFIEKALDLNESEKKALIEIIAQKMQEMEEIEKKRKKEVEEKNFETENARIRYEKLSFLQKIRYKLTKKTPDNVDFYFMSLDEVKNLYSSKKR